MSSEKETEQRHFLLGPTGATSSLEDENASRMTVLSSGWLLRSTWCPTSPNESRASSRMESVERLFFTS